ncbi:MAG: hypothetical protein HC890_02785 [Chloroflexaceae bacterium]|nr:hypothetical protein [Chloroflexaceae bacterium]
MFNFLRVEIDSIIPSEDRSNYSENDLELLAEEIMKCDSLLKPLILKKISFDSYQVIEGHLEYFSALKAFEKDERKYTEVNAFVLEDSDEQNATNQLQIIELLKDKRTDTEKKSVEEEEAEETAKKRLEAVFDRKFDELSRTLSSKIERLNVTANQVTPNVTPNDGINEITYNLLEEIKKLNEKITTKSFKFLLQEEVTLKSSEEKTKKDLIKTLQEALDELVKINLLSTNEKELSEALEKVRATKPQQKAAWNAVLYWRESGRQLTWENLKKSSGSGADTISGFGPGTYEKLNKIAEIGSN